MPYFQDDFTWCVQGAKKRPWLFSPMTAMTTTVWLVIIFGYGYITGYVLFLLIQFDSKYKQRNSRDWHYTTWLVSLPSFIGLGQTFRPVAWKVRLFYGLLLLTLLICSQTVTSYLMKFTQIRFLMHQIASIQEIVDNDFVLLGSAQVQNLIKMDNQVRI